MIHKAHFQNVRCLRDVKIGFEPLTALVGPNASGKSTVLKALSHQFPLGRTTAWHKSVDIDQNIWIEFERGRDWFRRYGPSKRGSTDNSGRKLDSYYELLHLHPSAMRKPLVVQEEVRLAPDGGNLANVFATLSRAKQIEVAQTLAGLVPVIRDVDVRPVRAPAHAKQGQHRLRFWDRWSEDVWYEPEEVSDGTILMLAFLVLQHQESAPEVIGIEEPERGLHPYLLEELVSFLRKLAHGEIGPRPIQVILATHSAELLDCLEPKEVRFLDRSEDGSVTVQAPPIDDPEFEKAIDAYRNALGEAWLSGGLGGVPGA